MQRVVLGCGYELSRKRKKGGQQCQTDRVQKATAGDNACQRGERSNRKHCGNNRRRQDNGSHIRPKIAEVDEACIALAVRALVGR